MTSNVEIDSQRRFVEIAIAVRRYETQTGQLPTKLDELVEVSLDQEVLQKSQDDLLYLFEPFEKNGKWRLMSASCHRRLTFLAAEKERH